ncbi:MULTISPECIES: CaiB/BaiF CoA transferase family protein [Streptomyces]|uniref:CaiB/BaiF CoA-transferase family protein n=1 Tax=Streptomyces doudnae TaxID=3075536 RepID=A0ABD5EV67_9ACTN|nr:MULTISPECIES: CaiB/BaiF CoA-transferase family protein [unclassified Streptomyces]MDT0438632.1 CaiB/BaiF CoA-transferase family protein [Streptomyces sp. DSM 41981]MYQ69058.1 CoA transferase [Streptomyces sp. SID4950]SCE51095.1 alpha-methylacyl-CoA racemase [Streptomyces sp. SolWspMP-5a-2]
MTGPLSGVRVVELKGIGPAPFCGMMLADLGADVVRVERPAPGAGPYAPATDVLGRGRTSVALNLKQPGSTDTVLDLVERADILIEGFRPGVMERLGLGPDSCLARNPALVYGRMTGWGQDGPYARTAGHDINYIAVSGALGAMGPANGPPGLPLNLLGDFGGGGMLLVVGVLAALLHSRNTGEGQVVDAAIVDGTATLSSLLYGLMAQERWTAQRGENFLDGSAPYYTVYPCADGRFLAVGALEDQFYRALLEGLGASDDPVLTTDRTRPDNWAAIRKRLEGLFASRPRQSWLEVFAGTDACVSPVLGLDDAHEDTHASARGTFIDVGGVVQPAPAPRFSRTRTSPPWPAPAPGRDNAIVLGSSASEPHRES